MRSINLFGASSAPNRLITNTQEMAASGAVGAARFASSPRIVSERGSGWLRQLRTQPLPARKVIAAKLLASAVLARSMTVLASGSGVLDRGSRLAGWQWAARGGVLWVRTATLGSLRMPVEILLKTPPRPDSGAPARWRHPLTGKRGTVVHVESLHVSDDTSWPKWAEFDESGPQGRLRRLRRIGWSALWMVSLIGPILAIFNGRFNGVEAIVAGLGLAGFAALWLRVAWAGWGTFRSTQPRGLTLLGLLAVLTPLLLAAYGSNGLVLLFYLTGACAIALPPRRTVPAVTAVTALMVAVCIGLNFSAIETAFYGFQTFMIGLLAVAVRRMRALIAELREAREELARLAVNEERLRFARDLHDLLGHSLSLIVLKSTLARKLLDRDPPGVAAELADIESVGRQSLVEVRQAVSGYRDQSLVAELDRARSALSAAGIDATVRTTGAPLPTDVDALLSWAVREGVTNVLRHSRAQRCEIAVRRGAETAELEVIDDGVALTGTVGEGGGSGLRGLTERMANSGGRLEAGPRPGGGFRLAVRLPAGTPADAQGGPGGRPRSSPEAVVKA